MRSWSGNRHRWTIALSGHHFIAKFVLQISNSLPFVLWEQWNFPIPDPTLDSRHQNHINVLLLDHKSNLWMSESNPDIAECKVCGFCTSFSFIHLLAMTLEQQVLSVHIASRSWVQLHFEFSIAILGRFYHTYRKIALAPWGTPRPHPRALPHSQNYFSNSNLSTSP